MLTFKRKLILTKAQEQKIDGWISTCRFLYNMCKEIQICSYRNKGKYVSKRELIRQLTEIRDIDWIADAPRTTLENAIARNDLAYKRFFKGAGFPKWANKKRYCSITFRQNITIKGHSIKLTKLGFIKMVKDSAIYGNIKTVIIKKEITGYFACITTDAVKSIQNQDESQVLGMDMGVTHFAVDSNGVFISNPRHFKDYEKKLRIENRSLARKQKGGKNWLKQARRLSLLHHKIGNVREDFLHKESTKIAKANNLVIMEDLDVADMVKNKNLSKHILDAGWATFRTLLEYKTTVVVINPKFTSQTCNSCGAKDAKSRISQSEFICTSCGESSNADENAALNILGKGLAHIRERKALA